MPSRTWWVASLLFVSGFCALAYQVSWLRDFRLVFGSSTAASAAVLAIFIGGLGAGGLLLGARADRHPRPLLFYAQLEAVIAVSAAATPLLLTLVRTIYVASGGSTRMGMTLATIVRVVLSALVLAVPTIAMGGTLPAAARGVTRDTDVRRQDVAALYAFNTLGAVCGCLLATFWLLELFGTRSTLWLVAAVNLLVAMMARQADRSLGTIEEPATPAAPPRNDAARGAAAPVPLVLLASGTVGFAFFLMETVWYRLLAPLLGGSVFTFGLVLAIALVGIGIGGLLYTLVAADAPATLSGFAMSCLIEAAAVAGTFALGDRIALLAFVLLPTRAAGFAASVAGWSIVASIVILPPALVAGYQFPLLIAMAGRGRDKLGRQIGATYAANTAGAIVGSLAGGFGLLPWLSAPGAWRLVAAVLAALGVAAIVTTIVKAKRMRPVMLAQIGLAAVSIALITTAGPTAVWRHSGIGAGRAPSDVFTAPNALHEWINQSQLAVVWEADGTESGVALTTGLGGYAFLVNGKSDGNARTDAGTQVMLGLLAALGPAPPKRALVIGLGTGSSAGWLGAIPQMERVDVVELEPLVLKVAEACRLVNQGVLSNPKVHTTIGDAREFLLTTTEHYDVIASEPSNPFRAGIASLFTVEYYRAAFERLNDDGAFVQWVQGYEIDPRTVQTVYATMATVFPQIETWQTTQADLVLVGSKRRRSYDAGNLAARLRSEPFKTALLQAWRAPDLNAFLSHYVANDALARALATAPEAEVNTDDRNLVEFGLARSVGRPGSLIIDELRRFAHQINAARPPIVNGDLSWSRIDTAGVAFNATVGSLTITAPDATPDEQARRGALIRYYGSSDVIGARNLWQQQTEGPRDPSELLMAADIEALTGSDSALPLIERLRAFQPGEADIVLARLRLRQSRLNDAATALESALIRYRTDPWALLEVKEQAIVLATRLAALDPSLAGRMFNALREPFALRALDNARLITAAGLAMRTTTPSACREPVGALEAHVPWLLDFLTTRRDCYRTTGDSRLAAAANDLNEFLAHEAQPFSALVPLP